MTTDTNLCVLVPAYREGGRIGTVVRDIRRYCDKVVVVDDGSPDNTAKEAEAAGAHVIRHAQNQGKGAAQRTGMQYAVDQGMDVLITMDGDGQHDPSDIPGFVREYERSHLPLIMGTRMGDSREMPLVRRLTNRFMSSLLSRRMRQRVTDTQCGFRLYKVDILPRVMPRTDRFDADSEILLNVADAGMPIGEVPVKVIYGSEQSKIRPFRDTLRFFGMLRRHEKSLPLSPVTETSKTGTSELS